MKRLALVFILLMVASPALAQAPDSTAAPDSTVAPDTLAAPPPAATPVAPPPPPPAVNTQTAPEPPSEIRTEQTYAKDNTPPKWYYGATIGFNFWGDVRRFSIQPLIGRKLTPRLSIGVELGYEHLKDTSGPTDHEYDNYGAGVFSNFKLTPRFYAHGEYDMISYDFTNGRELVPFLYVGGGIVQAAGRASLYAEVLVDILNDEDSPYNDYEPQVSIGVSVGF